MADIIIFWLLAVLTVASAMTVVLITNPIYSALALVMTMVGISALFVTLAAYFLAGVQLIVYAGAVTVLFVMVVMLFDLKSELQAFTRGAFSGAVKIASVGMLAGLIVGAILMSIGPSETTPEMLAATQNIEPIKALGKLLFSKYVFGFEALGVLLMIVAIGAVALSRSKGGTHAKH